MDDTQSSSEADPIEIATIVLFEKAEETFEGDLLAASRLFGHAAESYGEEPDTDEDDASLIERFHQMANKLCFDNGANAKISLARTAAILLWRHHQGYRLEPWPKTIQSGTVTP